MTELSAYEFSTLRGGPYTLSRGLGDGLEPILLVAPAGDYPSPESLQRLEHEFTLRAELHADWAARPVELLRRDLRHMLVLEDRGGEPLERLLGRPLDVATFLRIAVPLAVALGRVHARGLIHKDVKPANILVDTATSGVWFTGFGVASRLPREHQSPAPPEVIAGTLAYMAPEQTGRMNRSVDSRSDLYALGVTFYEMLTGTLPFTAVNPMEWVHCHIARQPVPPDERVAGIPAPLTAIVLRLLAKTAEDRYQTAVGLAFDLRRCLADLDAFGYVEAFPLGSQDTSSRLLIPEKLYGREREIEILLSAYDRVIAHATPELVLVSGYAGVGKSSVVNELYKVLVPPHGFFASGKFDQYKRDIPYATLAQAFQSLVRPLREKHALVSSEIARLERQDADAMRLYEAAIRSARQHGFVQNEGLAHEVAARFYAARGFEKISHLYRRDARDCYRRWGAEGKVRQLEQSHPELRENCAPSPATTMFDASVAQLDIGAVVKASHAISGEIVLARLIETLMTIALEHAGAERGLLILLRGNTPQIEAEAGTDRKTVEVKLRQDRVTSSELPESVLHTVIRTRESAILDDASAENPFSADAYFQQTRARSVLCVPLMKQATLIGVLYLENTLASHVFTPARISVLELLSSQAAISLEHARLYGQLIRENRERRTVEDALRVSEERWRNLVEGAPVGVALTDTYGRYVATNSTLQKMLGYSETELRGRSAVDFTHEDDRAFTEAVIEATAAGKPPVRVEKRYRHKDGSVIWAEISGFPVPVSGSTPLLAGIVVDITDRKRAEDELRRSEASLAEAQQISHTGSWRWKIDTGEVSVSAELGRILAVDPAGPLPRAATFIAMTHADDRPAFQDALDRAVRERIRFEHEYRLVLADGSVKRLHIVGRPDVARSGELEYTGVVMDITARRHAEEALRDTQEELTRAARLTTMGELAASIAHEINQPLTAIVSNGGAGLLWLNRETPDLEEVRDALSSMVSDGMRAGEVIRGLRALATKAGPQLAPLDIDDVIQQVLALTRSELQRHGVALRTDLAAGDRPVMGDRVQLQQVLLNLILNGIDAMNAVTNRPRGLRVSSTLSEPANVVVSVEDTGIGLDAAIAELIFDPFFTTKDNGLGMGLSICRSIIDAHGGCLWAEPRAPHGTSLRFTVPIAVET